MYALLEQLVWVYGIFDPSVVLSTFLPFNALLPTLAKSSEHEHIQSSLHLTREPELIFQIEKLINVICVMYFFNLARKVFEPHYLIFNSCYLVLLLSQ